MPARISTVIKTPDHSERGSRKTPSISRCPSTGPNRTIIYSTIPKSPILFRVVCSAASLPASGGFMGGWSVKASHTICTRSRSFTTARSRWMRYRVLVIAVHPEYWTREMYLRVKDWVFRQGGRLMYLGGNGLNCEVLLNSNNQMRCLSHVNSLNGELGGYSEDGTIEYESRMHRTLESEANLLGVVCTVSGIMTAAPYRVLDASHWIFEGTELNDGDLFGESHFSRAHRGRRIRT